jgi:hypothetical protein
MQPFPYSVRWKVVESLRDRQYVKNFPRDFGWKHSAVLTNSQSEIFYPSDLAIICILKHPISWSLSLHGKPYQSRNKMSSVQRMPLGDFVNMSWTTVGRENAPEGFANIMEVWNYKVRSYLNLRDIRPVFILKYEDLLEDPQSVLQNISEFFNLKTKNDFKNKSDSTKRDARSFDDIKKYYLEEKWRIKLPENHRKLYADKVDPELMEIFGYKL